MLAFGEAKLLNIAHLVGFLHEHMILFETSDVNSNPPGNPETDACELCTALSYIAMAVSEMSKAANSPS